MRCKICGRECPPGAKICRDCASARKRAFAVTVTEPLLAAAGLPSVGEPRFAPRPARRRPSVAKPVENETARPEAPAALPLHVVPRSLAAHWLIVGLGMVMAILVLLVKVLGNGGRAADDAGVTRSSAPQPVVAAPALPPPPAATAGSDPDAAVQAKALSDASPKSRATPRKALPRVDAPSAVVAAPPAPEPAPAARPPVAPPRPVEGLRPDPWQVMNEGLSRCAREDVLSRGACEQRLRLQYCPNYWGLVPQCPIGPTTDHGQ